MIVYSIEVPGLRMISPGVGYELDVANTAGMSSVLGNKSYVARLQVRHECSFLYSCTQGAYSRKPLANVPPLGTRPSPLLCSISSDFTASL